MKAGFFLNIAVVLLVAACAAGIFLAPRYNYGYFVQKIELIERSVNRLEDGFQKINLLAGGDEEKRKAVVSKIDDIAALMGILRGDLEEVSQIVAEHLARDHGPARRQPRANEETPGLKARPYTDPVVLSDELRAKARAISPRGMSELDFDKFLGEAMAQELVRSDRVEDIPPSALLQIKLIYLLFKDNVLFVNQDEMLYVHSAVEELKLGGIYEEVPVAADGSLGTVEGRDGKGIVVSVKSPTNKAARLIFKLPLEQYPKLSEFDTLRENIRDHMVEDLSKVRLEEDD